MFTRLATSPLASMWRSFLLAILIASAAFAVALPSSALAVDNSGTGYASCFYGGEEYSHGSIIEFDDGNYYKCDDGSWEYYESGVSESYHAPGQDQFIETVNEYPVFDLNPVGGQPNVINIDEPGNAAPNVAAP